MALLGLAAGALNAAGPTGAIPIAIIWDTPGPQYTNLQYVLAWNTNLSSNPTNWPSVLLTNVIPLNATQLVSTNSFLPSPQLFVALSWTNRMWRTSSFFSDPAAADPYPLPGATANLRLSPVP